MQRPIARQGNRKRQSCATDQHRKPFISQSGYPAKPRRRTARFGWSRRCCGILGLSGPSALRCERTRPYRIRCTRSGLVLASVGRGLLTAKAHKKHFQQPTSVSSAAASLLQRLALKHLLHSFANVISRLDLKGSLQRLFDSNWPLPVSPGGQCRQGHISIRHDRAPQSSID